MVTRRQIVDCARGYLGTPFQHQGRLRGRACDCVGLVICVARDLGLALPGEALGLNYPPEPADDTVLRLMRRYLREKEEGDMAPGDILCMRVPMPCHAAVVSDLLPGLGIVHAYSGNGRVVEHGLDPTWRRRLEAVFSFPEVEEKWPG